MSANQPAIRIHSERQTVPISQLVPYSQNPRTHSENQILDLMGKMQRFGFANPIHVDENYMILAGHCRYEAARRLNLNQVSVLVMRGLTDAEKRAFIIADNRSHEMGEWDDAALGHELRVLEESGFALEVLGFEGEELSRLIGSVEIDPIAGIAPVETVPPPESSSSSSTQGEAQYFPFSVNLTADDRAMVNDTIRRVKDSHQYESNADALIEIFNFYNRRTQQESISTT